MNSKNILKLIKALEADYKGLFLELSENKLLNSKKYSYTKEDKDSFLLLWAKYVVFFTKLQNLIRKSKYRSFFFVVNYNNLLIRRYLLIFYFNCLPELLNNFWEHEEFIRTLLLESAEVDYWDIAKYIYRPNFINLLNTPGIFITFHKDKIEKKFYFMLESEKVEFTNDKRILTDYKNFYYYFKRRALKILLFVSKHISHVIAKTRFSTRTKWLITQRNIKLYLSIAKPGDIFLTRWNWNASNISIPWFWKHMSMYLWSWEFLKKNFWNKFKSIKNLNDNAHYIIEATWEWVEIVDIDDFISHNDYLWVSRTNFSKEKILRTIKNSLKYFWANYDYLFNFYSNKSVVCSELIMKSYAKEFKGDDWIKIKLEKIGVSLTYPPNNFIKEIFSNKSSLEPIIFIDSIEKTGKNFVSGKKEFKNSFGRSRFSFMLK